MSKDKSFEGDLFAKTEKEQQPEEQQKSQYEAKTPGIYFSAEEVERIEKVMQGTGEDSFYKVVKMAVTYFLNKYEAGEIGEKTKTKKELDLS